MPIINQVVKGGGGSAPAYYIEKTVDANGKLINSSSAIHLNGATDVDSYVLYYACYQNTVLTSVDMSSLTEVSGSNACANMLSGCSGLTTANLGSLTVISGSSACGSMFSGCSLLANLNLSSLTKITGSYGCSWMFQNCSEIPSLDLSSLIAVSGNQAANGMFFNCSGITSVDISRFTTIDGNAGCQNMFQNCSGIPSIVFYSLKILDAANACYNMFNGCSRLTSVSFPALKSNMFGSSTNQFSSMLRSVTGCTVHFPSNLQSVIGSWSDVTNGFGGTNTTVLFDLPATVNLTGNNSVEYERNPKYDTQTALAWRVKDTGTTSNPIIDWTAYYTSGTSDPVAGDTIYSDASCTTALTTIDSIA